MPKNASAPSTAVLTVFRLAALFTFLAVAMGAVVCATGSGASCPTWPGCRPDQITPQWQLSPLIEFTHRVVAMSAGPLVLAAAVMSTRLRGPNRWVRILPLVALAGALAAGAFGRTAVLNGLPTWLGGVDLFSALTAMTAMGVAAVMLGAPAPDSSSPSSAEGRPVQVFRLAATSLTVLVAMHVTGIFAAGHLSYTRCIGWPIWQLIGSDLHPWLQGLRLGLAGLGAGLVVTTALVATRNERLRGWGIHLGTLFAAEMMLGLVIRAGGINASVASVYSVLAVALLSSLGLLMAVAWSARVDTDVPPLQPAPPRREPAEPGRF
ncbi:MAG TPA: COX15/CtaA family protein [Dermatophilaceae bacterium]|nr:COX15/CtaA family protein [Dermatophilaceae bacterium]